MDRLNEIEQRALAAIDFDEMARTICDWVAIPSLDGAETEMQRAVAEKLTEIGMAVDLWEIDFDALEKHPAYCAEVDRAEGLGVVGMVGGDQGKSLILNGHVDVVPAGDEDLWDFPAWQGTIANGNLYGRGALDMKGGLACGVYAVKAIIDAGIQLKGKLSIQSVIGEEDGGSGALATILRGHVADAAIIMEPTELMIAPAQAGAMNFRVTVPGRSAHGCIRAEGISAIEKFILIYQALIAFEKERNDAVTDPLFTPYELPIPLSVGTIQGGNWASTVPESVSFEGRFGIAVGENMLEARQKFEAVVAQAAANDPWLRDNPPTIEWWGGQFDSAGIAVNEPIVTTVSAAWRTVSGQEPILQGMPYGADMRLLVNEGGIPTLMFGAGDIRQAHSHNEYVPLVELRLAVQTLVLTILRFCDYVS